MVKNPLHDYIGKLIYGNVSAPYEAIRDSACGGEQHIPLFCSEDKSNAVRYCNVDLLILYQDKIKVIIEIEESNVKPTQICGKFLTSALAKYYIHNSKKYIPITMSNSVLFVQILDTKKLDIGKTAKFKQWEYIEDSIRGIIKKAELGITYEIFYTDLSSLKSDNIKRNKIVDTIKSFLK